MQEYIELVHNSHIRSSLEFFPLSAMFFSHLVRIFMVLNRMIEDKKIVTLGQSVCLFVCLQNLACDFGCIQGMVFVYGTHIP